MGAPRTMPSAEMICDYWDDDQRLAQRNVMLDVCWMCGYIGKLERAHIISKWKGGTDTPDNLHLLCISCHRETEVIGDAEQYWRYFLATDYKIGHPNLQRIKKLVAAGVDLGLSGEQVALLREVV